MFAARRYILNAVPLALRRGYARARPFKRTTKKKQAPLESKMRYQDMFGHNPGVGERLKALDLTEKEISGAENLEDFESQFWNVDKMQDQIDREEFIHKELLGIYQVNRKHFKEEKLPNMLLWEEKQEIKSLHAQDPEKWSIMKLAYSYPASPTVIKKILKTNWKMRTHEEVERHDNRVRQNWDALAKGKLEIPNEDLRKHLLSFTNRSVAPTPSSTEIGLPRKADYNPLKHILKDGGVFGNIYNKHKPKSESGKADDKNNEAVPLDVNPVEEGLKALNYPPPRDTFVVPRKVLDVKQRTLDPLPLEEMKKRVLQDTEKRTMTRVEERFISGPLSQEEVQNYESLWDPIGKAPSEMNDKSIRENIELSTHSNHAQRLAIGNVRLSDHSEHTHNNLPPLEVTQNAPREIGHEENSVENDILIHGSKFVDISKLSDFEEKEDKEFLASVRTAKKERDSLTNEVIVKAVRSYVSTSSDSYPLEITIPKDKWKKGALYRVKDRFYADDGEFLFRVPGLSKE